MKLEDLYTIVRDRAETRPAGSDTLRFLDSAVDGLGKKLIEEAAESWMAAKFEDRDAVSLELSQVFYFAVCLMVVAGVELDDVLDRL